MGMIDTIHRFWHLWVTLQTLVRVWRVAAWASSLAEEVASAVTALRSVSAGQGSDFYTVHFPAYVAWSVESVASEFVFKTKTKNQTELGKWPFIQYTKKTIRNEANPNIQTINFDLSSDWRPT